MDKDATGSLTDVQDCNDTYFSQGNHPAMISASVEGPYGHETPYFLRYGHLILVAGGIGVSPFIAILRDILHRHHQNQTKTSLPIHILLVWSVKTSDELCLLDMIDMATICPSFSKDLDLEIQTYVTQESEPPLEEGNTSDMNTVLTFSEMHPKRVVSGLVGTGDTVWFGLYSLSSTIGFIVLVALVKSCLSWESYEYYTWYQGLCGIICMFARVILCGGPVVILWHIYQRKFSDQDVQSDDKSRGSSNQFEENTALPLEALEFTRSQYGPTYYGRRPNFEETFDSVSDEWRNVEVGVVVCGPVGLQSSVAAECRSRNLRGQLGTPMFHFHSHSFEF